MARRVYTSALPLFYGLKERSCGLFRCIALGVDFATRRWTVPNAVKHLDDCG